MGKAPRIQRSAEALRFFERLERLTALRSPERRVEELERLRRQFPTYSRGIDTLVKGGARLEDITAYMRRLQPQGLEIEAPPQTLRSRTRNLFSTTSTRLSDATSRVARAWSSRNPLADLLTLPASRASNLKDREQAIALAARQQAVFDQALERATESPDQLRVFAEQQVGKSLGAGQRKAIMTALAKHGSAWPEVASFYERSIRQDPTFRNYDVAAEDYIVALNKSGRVAESISFARDHSMRLIRTGARRDDAPSAARNASAYGERFQLDSITPTNSVLVRSGLLNGEVLGGLGKAFREISDGKVELDPAVRSLLAEAAGRDSLEGLSPAQIQRLALEVSTRMYETGFRVDLDYYPGVNAVNNHFRLGNVKYAESLAELVLTATQQRTGKRSTDYWGVSTELGLAIAARDMAQVPELAAAKVRLLDGKWKLESSVESMAAVAESRGWTPVERVLKEHYEAILAEGKFPPAEERVAKMREDLARAAGVEARPSKPAAEREFAGFQFEGVNAYFNGGELRLPDGVSVVVNRRDVQIAQELMERAGLSEMRDFEQWNEGVNQLLRSMAPAAMRSVDRAVDPIQLDLLRIAHAGESGRTEQNLFATFSLGTANENTLAVTKQLMFDLWKSNSMNRLMVEAYDARFGAQDSRHTGEISRDLETLAKTRLTTVERGEFGGEEAQGREGRVLINGLVVRDGERSVVVPRVVASDTQSRLERYSVTVTPNAPQTPLVVNRLPDDAGQYRVAGHEVAPPSARSITDNPGEGARLVSSLAFADNAALAAAIRAQNDEQEMLALLSRQPMRTFASPSFGLATSGLARAWLKTDFAARNTVGAGEVSKLSPTMLRGLAREPAPAEMEQARTELLEAALEVGMRVAREGTDRPLWPQVVGERLGRISELAVRSAKESVSGKELLARLEPGHVAEVLSIELGLPVGAQNAPAQALKPAERDVLRWALRFVHSAQEIETLHRAAQREEATGGPIGLSYEGRLLASFRELYMAARSAGAQESAAVEAATAQLVSRLTAQLKMVPTTQ